MICCVHVAVAKKIWYLCHRHLMCTYAVCNRTYGRNKEWTWYADCICYRALRLNGVRSMMYKGSFHWDVCILIVLGFLNWQIFKMSFWRCTICSCWFYVSCYSLSWRLLFRCSMLIPLKRRRQRGRRQSTSLELNLCHLKEDFMVYFSQ